MHQVPGNGTDFAMNDHTESMVPALTKIAYSVPAFSLAVVGIPVYVYIPKFYTDVVGVNIILIGHILLTVRIFDALTDPILGYLSDRTRTRMGRRRPYIGWGSLFVALAMYFLFNPPHTSPFYETIWFTVTIYALFLSWTAVTVPYESLGPEITFNYNERTTIFGLRDGLLIAGTLAAASSPLAVQWLFNLADDPAGERLKFFWTSVIYAPLLIGSCWLCVLAVREIRPQHPEVSTGIWRGLRQTFRNRPFVILLTAYTVSAIGSNLPAALILYYVEYVLLSQMAEAFLLLYFVTGILFLPGWIAISKRRGKKLAWLASMAINSGAFAGVFFLGPGDTVLYGILVFLSGTGFGATLAIPSSIQADVIDYDELLTDERREGQYVGLWAISKKLAAAVGVGAGLSILGLSGYEPNTGQSEQVRLALRVLYALVPSACNLLAILIALKYPITEALHQKIREGISIKKQGRPVADPLNPDLTLD